MQSIRHRPHHSNSNKNILLVVSDVNITTTRTTYNSDRKHKSKYAPKHRKLLVVLVVGVLAVLLVTGTLKIWNIWKKFKIWNLHPLQPLQIHPQNHHDQMHKQAALNLNLNLNLKEHPLEVVFTPTSTTTTTTTSSTSSRRNSHTTTTLFSSVAHPTRTIPPTHKASFGGLRMEHTHSHSTIHKDKDKDKDKIKDNQVAPRRVIHEDDYLRYHVERDRFLNEIDADISSDEDTDGQEDYHETDNHQDQNNSKNKSNPRTHCRPPNWIWNYYPLCNTFHEMNIQQGISSSREQPQPQSSHTTPTTTTNTNTNSVSIQYLNQGASRQAWLIKPFQSKSTQSYHTQIQDEFPFVLKTLRTKRFEPDDILDHYRKVHTEALITERLSSSPYIIDIYGHCGTSTLVEQASDITELIVPEQDRPHSTIQSARHRQSMWQSGHYHSDNDKHYTPLQKLELALAMAQSIAALHGYSGGVMVNSDIHIEQWVQSLRTGTIKLSDMNNAFFLYYDETRQQYCPEYVSYGGDFHSPEEFRGSWVREHIDVYSMGNNIHCLLSGTWQFPWLQKNSDIQALVMDGQRDHIDFYRHQSFLERRLVEIMEQAWIDNPKDRPSIFEIVDQLQDTKRLYYENKSSSYQQQQQ